MEKVKIYKIWIEDAYMATVHKDNIIEEVKNQMDMMDCGEEGDLNEVDFTITIEEMDEKEYNELPEFEGF